MNVASVLERVTVYRHGAVCERTAELTLAAPQRVRVVGLPLSARPASLRARVVGDPALHVLDVRAGFDVELGADVDLAAEARALEAAQQDVARLQLQQAGLDRELAELGALRPEFREPPRREGPRPVPLDAMLALAEFVLRRTEALHANRRAVSLELEDARERERTCGARLREAGSSARTARALVTRAAIVTLTGVPSCACSLTIEYEIPGAAWVPTYQLALGEGSGGKLSMRASIAQRSGEDWTGVRLSLCTASLRRRTQIPELRSLRVGRAQPEPQRAGWRPPPPGLDGLFVDYDAAISRTARPVPAKAMRRLAPPSPAMPQPMAVPMPAAMPAPMMAPPSVNAPTAVGGAAFGAAGAPPIARAAMQSMPAPGAAPQAQDRARYSASRDEADAELDLLAESTGTQFAIPSAPLGPSEAQLDYDGLEVAGPDGPSRGRLAPASAATMFLAAGVHVQIDVVVAAVARAEQAAASLASIAPPQDCVAVDAQARFDYRYEAQAPADVPSTGTWTNVAVMDCEVDIRAQYVCVPAVDPAVYRTLELTNRSTHALLPGPIDVAHAGQFLLTTTLGAIGPGAKGPRIGLGVEEGIKVARNTRFAETSGGIFGGTTVLAHEIDIEIDNRLGVTVGLEIRERVPVVDASEKDLKLEEHDATPSWEAVDTPEDGVLVHGLRRWRVTVAAGTKAELVGKYTVRIPSDRMLVGGNRRS